LIYKAGSALLRLVATDQSALEIRPHCKTTSLKMPAIIDHCSEAQQDEIDVLEVSILIHDQNEGETELTKSVNLSRTIFGRYWRQKSSDVLDHPDYSTKSDLSALSIASLASGQA
jgi:hypothetical protein